MIKRIVKMTFKPEYVQDFLDLFNSKKELISAVEGCKHLELLKDLNNPTIFFTLSIWENEQTIENYRNSELFESVWAKTKVLFNDKPEAWSVLVV